MCVHAFIYLSYMNTVYLYRLVARDTDLPLAATLLKAYAKVEPLTIAELNYLLSLLHPRTLTSYVPGELLALTWTKGGVMLHAPNAVKLQHTVSSIAFVRCDNAHAVGTFRYRVETAIADGTAEGAFFCFDGVVTKLHSLRASEAGQMLLSPSKYMKQFISQMQGDTDSTSKLIGYCMCVHAFIYLSYMNTVYLYRLVARDTDLPLAATLLKAYAKVEPLTIAELNYLLSLLHPRTLTSYVPGELLALTWTKGGVMMHAPNAVKLQHTVSAIAFVRCDNAHAVGTFRYRVETTIADGTAEGAFFCFDGVVTKLHSLRASEAGQMLAEGVNPEDFKMPPFTTHIEAKTYTFQFSVIPDVVDNIGSDDDGDDMPDGNPIPVKVETGGSSGEAAFNADTDPVGVRRRRRPTHLPRWLRRRVWLEID
ncbi:BnaC06g12370D [Brassica napus]|uniref:BnaC06g12370D protein n=1 Tax=Brassica napus TaxID=3708 RepID=A0A078IGG6_BRANA|nr:BnaC06g12370D [Brassica napus]